MIPADLLARLQEADSELWERYAETDLSREEEGIDLGWMTAEAQDAWLQHCLQEAIRARGWEFVLRSVTMGRTPGFEAIVYKVRGQKRGVAYTESEALCWAYLEAIEAIPAHEHVRAR